MVEETDRISARVGPVKFKDEFDDPIVDVVQKFRTVEHDIVTNLGADDEFVVQHLGRKPPQITVNAVLTQSQLETLQEFGSGGAMFLRTVEWTGTVIPKRISEKPRREKVNGEWLYDMTFKLTGKERGAMPSGYTGESDPPDLSPRKQHGYSFDRGN